jgi:multidrug resistance efflux pump
MWNHLYHQQRCALLLSRWLVACPVLPLLCSVAFRWLLNDHEYVPHQELVAVRGSVVQVSSRVIGVMSRIRLADITTAFSQKMEERVSS